MSRKRLDSILVDRRIVESREKAQRLIYAGRVLVDGNPADKPGRSTRSDCAVELIEGEKFVGRGGEKLEHALDIFHLNILDMICLDVGASTGGFTDCMLQHGAQKVYAVDAGRGQLHWRLRNDHRVIMMEKTNARYLCTEDLSESPDFATVDVSFISLTKILPSVKNVIRVGAAVISLVKPQFEAARHNISRGGVVREPEIRDKVLEDIRIFGTHELGLLWLGVCESPLRGPAGNIEYLAYWKKQ